MTSPSKRLYISATKLRTYLGCAHRVALEKKHRPDLAKWRVGRAVHAAIESASLERWQAPDGGDPWVSQAELLVRLAEVEGSAKHRLDTEERARAYDILTCVNRLRLGPQLCKPETSFSIDLGDGITCRGRWDHVRGTEEEPEVVDWKAVFPSVNQPDALADPQVGLYLVAAKERWPQARTISMTLAYVNEPRTIVTTWTAQLDAYWRSLAKAAARQIARGYDEPTTGSHCAYCPVREECAAVVEYEKSAEHIEGGPLGALDFDELLEKAYAARAVIKNAEASKKALDAEVRRRLDAGETATNGIRASLRSRDIARTMPEALPSIARDSGVKLAPLLAQVVTGVSETALKRVTGWPDGPELGACQQVKRIKYLDIRRKK